MEFYGLTDIIFPNLGITIKNLPMGISVFGFQIAFYGIIVATGMLVGYLIAERNAKKYGIDPEKVMDFALIAIILSVIGARAYYVIFHWESFADNPISVFNLRTGGLAIYGGVIVAITSAIVFCRIKKINLGRFVDVCIPGLVMGQVIGRWANFFNREAFGSYTDNLFAMLMNKSAVGGDYNSTEALLKIKYADNPQALEKILEQYAKAVEIDGVAYIQAHPTFLYESVWNLCVFIFLMVYAKYKRFHGELLAWYAVLYGIGRFWIEALRTDQLFFFNTTIPVSQIVAVLMVIGGLAYIGINYFKLIKAGRFAKPDVYAGLDLEWKRAKEEKKTGTKDKNNKNKGNGIKQPENSKVKIQSNPDSKVKIEK